MPIERRARPIRLPLPLQRSQVLVEPRCDGVRRHAQLVRVMAIVSDKIGLRSCRNRVGGFQFLDFRDDGGLDGVVGEWGGVAEFNAFEAGERGEGDAV